VVGLVLRSSWVVMMTVLTFSVFYTSFYYYSSSTVLIDDFTRFCRQAHNENNPTREFLFLSQFQQHDFNN